jgi:hypothetical protein
VGVVDGDAEVVCFCCGLVGVDVGCEVVVGGLPLMLVLDCWFGGCRGEIGRSYSGILIRNEVAVCEEVEVIHCLACFPYVKEAGGYDLSLGLFEKRCTDVNVFLSIRSFDAFHHISIHNLIRSSEFVDTTRLPMHSVFGRGSRPIYPLH